MPENDIKIEELKKKIKEDSYRITKLKEAQVEYEESLKTNQKFIEATKYINGEYQIPHYRQVRATDNILWDDVSKLPTQTINGQECHMIQDGYIKTDINWLLKNKPELYNEYQEILSKSFGSTIVQLEYGILEMNNSLAKLEALKQKELDEKYEQILGTKISGEHEVQIVGDGGISRITRKTPQEINAEMGKLRIRLNELEQSGQIDEDLHEELLNYIDSKYNKILLENQQNTLSKYDEIYKQLYEEEPTRKYR